jgi:hypothetical protein
MVGKITVKAARTEVRTLAALSLTTSKDRPCPDIDDGAYRKTLYVHNSDNPAVTMVEGTVVNVNKQSQRSTA